LHRVLFERLRIQAPPSQAVARVERDRGEPSSRVAGDRAALKGTLGIEKRRLHHVLGVVMVMQLALDDPDEPGAVLPIQPLNLGGHA
jgi:hypothetical protein